MLDVFPKIAKVPFFDKKISEKVCVALHYVEVEDGLIWSEMYHYPYIFCHVELQEFYNFGIMISVWVKEFYFCQPYNINHVAEMTKADPFDQYFLLSCEEVALQYHVLDVLLKIRITLFFDYNVPQKHV